MFRYDCFGTGGVSDRNRRGGITIDPRNSALGDELEEYTSTTLTAIEEMGLSRTPGREDNGEDEFVFDNFTVPFAEIVYESGGRRRRMLRQLRERIEELETSNRSLRRELMDARATVRQLTHINEPQPPTLPPSRIGSPIRGTRVSPTRNDTSVSANTGASSSRRQSPQRRQSP